MACVHLAQKKKVTFWPSSVTVILSQTPQGMKYVLHTLCACIAREAYSSFFSTCMK